MFRTVFRIMSFVFLVEGLLVGSARADLTHSGKVDVDLVLVDANGNESKVDNRKGDYHLDWKTGKCEIELQKNLYAYCNLDVTKNLNAPGGALLVNAMPTAHFTVSAIEGVFNLLGQGDKRTSDIMAKVVQETTATRSAGFDLPFYTCEKCSVGSNGKIPVWNAYDSFVFRTIEINHPLLVDKKLVLKMRLHAMSAVTGAFPIIGTNAAGNFGTH